MYINKNAFCKSLIDKLQKRMYTFAVMHASFLKVKTVKMEGSKEKQGL